MEKIIYLDVAATTPVHEEVVAEMNKFYLENYGNPSSQHELGENAQKAINEARKNLAKEINAKPQEIIFTSGSTESNNLAFFGLAKTNKNKKKIIISAIEHSSIFEICNSLKESYKIIEIPVNKEGLINIEKLEKEIDKDTLLVSIIHANNEIGSIQDIEKIGKLCKENKVYFHTDAAQSFGKLDIDVKKMNITLLTASAHKISGPKGIGLLYVKENVNIAPIIHGGGQERNLRGGTENVPAIVGFAKALEITKKSDKNKIAELRNYFIQKLENINGKINGSKEGIYNIINVSFPKTDAEKIVLSLSQKGIMCSTGSACESKKKIENKTLKAIGLNEKEINSSLRFSFSDNIKNKDIDFVAEQLTNALKI